MHHHYGKRCPTHLNALFPFLFSIVLYTKLQCFGATLKFDPHFFLLNKIIQIILVAFSMKTSMACTGMLSYETEAFKFPKTAKTTNST